jgi:hypothetical protein
MGEVKRGLVELQQAAFDDALSEADEALLEMLENEWLERQHAAYLEDYDYWQVMATPRRVQ